jgi:hypothetical protein
MFDDLGVRRYLVLLALASFAGAGGAAADDRRHDSTFEGTWFCSTSIQPGFGINATQMLLTAGAEGTIKTAETDDLTGFNPTLGAQGFAVQTSGAGGWRKKGRRAHDLNYLQLGFGGTGPSTGLFSYLTRFRCAVKLDDDAIAGYCDADLWFASDPDGDGIPNSPNPATTAAHVVIPDLQEITCDRLNVAPKQ